MTTLYVAGPMSGLPDFNYPAFNAAAHMLSGFGYDVLNPVDSEEHNPTPGSAQTWDWYMRHALRMVLNADALALLPGWENSRGASTEVYVALALGMEALPLEDWVERTCDAPKNDDGADAPEPPVAAVEGNPSVETATSAPSSPTGELRWAAEWLRDPYRCNTVGFEHTLAELLDEFANAAQHLDEFDGFDPFVTIDGYGNALTIARLINGGAA